jgi:single-strand DNA-binding protein
MLNKVMLLGHLGGDPEVRYTPGGMTVATFSLATSEKFTDKSTGARREETQWHRIVAWGKLADLCKEYLHKGSRIYLEGKLVYRKWEDNSGVSRVTPEVRMAALTMLDSKPQKGKPQGSKAKQGQDEDVPF